jgi:hypothetical protein
MTSVDITTRADAEAYVTAWMRFMRTIHERHPRPAGWVYSGHESFLERHGRFFTPSTAIPAGVRRGLPKNCFDNAYREARRSKGRYHYVEGLAFCAIPTLHAWLIDAAGTVIDPTWDDHLVGLAYFGVELSLAEVATTRRGGWCCLLDDWKRQFPAARGVPVLAPDAWFAEAPTRPESPPHEDVPHGICGP